MTQSSDVPAPAAVSKRELHIILAGLMLAMVLAALDQSILNTALPRIVSDLGGMEHLSWIVTAFMLTSTATTPIYGKLSDMYGRRRLFVIAILIFLVGSALCGLADSMTQLIVFRALQGLGAGGLITLAQTAISDVVSPRERGRYQGLFTGVFAVSSVTGPLIGGVLTETLSWRWVFYVNLPIGLVALALIALGLKQAPPPRVHRIDYAGAGLLTGITTALLLLLSWAGSLFPWHSPEIGGLAVLALLLGAAFYFQERRAAQPIIGLHLFRNRSFSAGAAAAGLMSFAMLGSTVFLPLYFQLVLGKTPTEAGLMMLPQVAGMLLSSVIGGRWMSRVGRFKPFALTGVGLEVVALGSLAFFALIAAPAMVFEISMLLLGLGMGTGMPVVTTAVQNSVEHRDIGAATSSMGYLRSLGGALGISLSGSIMASRLAELLAEQVPGIDIRALLEHGLNELARLSAADQVAVVAAYRWAISTSFAMSAVVMAGAFLLIVSLPPLALKGSTGR